MKEAEEIFNIDEAEVLLLKPGEEQIQNEPEEFWYLEDDEVKLNRQQFLSFLEKRGYRKYYVGKEYMFVQIENNIVKEVTKVNIKDHIRDFIQGLGETTEDGIRTSSIWGKVINQVGTLFSANFLELIPNVEGEFKRDTETNSFIYYQNCFVWVTPNGYTTHNYTALDGYIWESQKVKRNFEKSNNDSVFKKFILKICKDDPKRFNALRSAIGYLLHSHKDPANTKAIVFIDERPGDGANGRCGKSLVGKAISKIRKSVRRDGKNFKFNQFMFQSVKPDTAIIDFNDVTKGFPFENLFSIITDDMAVEEKNKAEVIVPFERSPKILITTNHAIKGVDASTLDREFVIEFSDYFNEKHKPVDEFGKKFFEPFWNIEEWTSFDNFMIECLRDFLSKGLLEYERINLFDKILIESTSEDFVEFVEDLELEKKYDNKELFNEFLDVYPEHKTKLMQKTFTLWVKTLGSIKGYKYLPKKSGKERGFILSNPKSGRMDDLKTGTGGEGDIF